MGIHRNEFAANLNSKEHQFFLTHPVYTMRKHSLMQRVSNFQFKFWYLSKLIPPTGSTVLGVDSAW